MSTKMGIHHGARPDQRRLASAALVMVGLVYITAYGLANRLTQARDDVGTAVFDWERMIPFAGWTIVPYLSIVVFFAGAFFLCRDQEQLRAHVQRVLAVLAISLACFALWPLRFTFERPVTEGLIGALFDLLQTLDLPYNRAPSLHVALVVTLWAVYSERLQGVLRLAVGLWSCLIALSVLTTYQHHVIDVPTGALVGWFCVRFLPSSGAERLVERIAYRARAMSRSATLT